MILERSEKELIDNNMYLVYIYKNEADPEKTSLITKDTMEKINKIFGSTLHFTENTRQDLLDFVKSKKESLIEKKVKPLKQISYFDKVQVGLIDKQSDLNGYVNEIFYTNKDSVTKVLNLIKNNSDELSEIFKKRGYESQFEDLKKNDQYFDNINPPSKKLLFFSVALEAYIQYQVDQKRPALDDALLTLVGEFYTLLKHVDRNLEEAIFKGHSRKRAKVNQNNELEYSREGKTSSVLRSYFKDVVEFCMVRKTSHIDVTSEQYHESISFLFESVDKS